MHADAEPWWRQVVVDRETARVTLAADRWYAASWFAQQVTEKGLKALFVERQQRQTPRTHDLEYLGRAINAPTEILDELNHLNTIFDLVRYPDAIGGQAPVDHVNQPMAAQDLAAAEEVATWLRLQLGE